MDKKYSIEFNQKQLRTVATALEFYSRFLAGQWEIPKAMQEKEYELQGNVDNFWDKRNYVEEGFELLKQHLTILLPNEFHAIGSENLSNDAKIAYDIYRPIWEQFAKEYNELHPDEPRYSVYDYPGLTYSKEGRVTINTINNETG